MFIEIDFSSDEAIYLQLKNQIIMSIATARIQEGDSLPSVRQLAETVGVNMHTVNKAYAILKQEGFVRLDRRKGAIIALDANAVQAMAKLRPSFELILARAALKGISREEVHWLTDEIWDSFEEEALLRKHEDRR